RALAGSGLLSWDLPSTDDPGGAHLGGSAPAASDPVVLLGWINNTQGGSAVGNSTAVENIFSIAASPYPTDGQWWDLGRGIPDNTYLVDRNSTIMRVRLAAIGVATLEWDGVNRSMLADGPNWSASVLGLRNGAYSYRVWATNETGAPFATPIRHLSVGVGIWRIEQVGYGFWPSVTVNATGYPRMCYYGGGGLFYAERSRSGWWTNATIDGGGQACSITVNSRGEARISHLAGTADGNYDIRYAYQRGGNWSTAIVQHGFYTYTSIAMNPITDEPMIAYSQINTEGLKLATLSHDVWTTQVVDPSCERVASLRPSV